MPLKLRASPLFSGTIGVSSASERPSLLLPSVRFAGPEQVPELRNRCHPNV